MAQRQGPEPPSKSDGGSEMSIINLSTNCIHLVPVGSDGALGPTVCGWTFKESQVDLFSECFNPNIHKKCTACHSEFFQDFTDSE